MQQNIFLGRENSHPHLPVLPSPVVTDDVLIHCVVTFTFRERKLTLVASQELLQLGDRQVMHLTSLFY